MRVLDNKIIVIPPEPYAYREVYKVFNLTDIVEIRTNPSFMKATTIKLRDGEEINIPVTAEEFLDNIAGRLEVN